MRKSVKLSLLIFVLYLCNFGEVNNSSSQSVSLSNSDLSQKNGFITHEEFIDGLYINYIDLNDPKQVFWYVFSMLDKEIFFYPTENYYYFTFPANGKTYSGCIGFSAHNRDDGILDIGYTEKHFDKHKQTNIMYQATGGWGVFNEKDGVKIEKLNDFKYAVTFNEKTVIFRLNDIGIHPPQKSKLTEDEIFIGPCFDESGLKFFLVFNTAVNHFYWILNEDGFVPENFTTYTDNIIIGDRTEFAFYLDRENERKILIGVEGYNVLNNNWYDGPFDQLPDNYIKTNRIEIKKYIEAYLPNVKGKIDKYGRYIYEKGTRVAIAPYIVYFSKEDLVDIVSMCRYSLTNTRSEFLKCITQQIYNVPEDIDGIER